MRKKKLLIVDDNDNLCEALKTVFEDEYELTFASTGMEALAQSRQRHPEVVLMDYRMPGMDGIETLLQIRAEDKQSHVVLMSAYADTSVVVKAMRQGAASFVGKPFNVQEIRSVVRDAVATASPATKLVKQADDRPVISQREVDDLIAQTLRYSCV